MRRCLKKSLLVAAIFTGASLAPIVHLSADVTVIIDESSEPRGMTTYRLTVTPAAEPQPAFKYRLTVLPQETIPGNAITHYLRSFGEGGLTGPLQAAEKKFGMEIHDWNSLETPAREIPLDSLREVAGYFDGYVDNHIARASRCRFCEWGLAEEDLTGMELINFLLPSIQQTRSISRVLSMRTRLAIIDGRYDDAINHLRMNYQLGQNVSKMKFLVAGLVSVAEVGIAHQNMIELVGTKDSPNMYWALAELPSPLADMRSSIRLECNWGLGLIPELADVETAEHSDDEWTRILNKTTDAIFSLGNMLENDPVTGLTASAIALLSYPGAKQRLVEQGMDAAKVETMSVGQVLVIDLTREYRRLANEVEKSLYVPFSENMALANVADDLMPRGLGEMNFGTLLASQQLPAVQQVRAASQRIEQQRKALQVVEAIRMHLAEHGKFPAGLDEVTVVPIPLNPCTDKPFRYWLDGEKAVLDLPWTDGVNYAYRFELQTTK